AAWKCMRLVDSAAHAAASGEFGCAHREPVGEVGGGQSSDAKTHGGSPSGMVQASRSIDSETIRSLRIQSDLCTRPETVSASTGTAEREFLPGAPAWRQKAPDAPLFPRHAID